MSYSEILDELNELQEEYEDLIPCIEYLEDVRADDGLPPFTAEERAEAEKKIDDDAYRAAEIDARQGELLAMSREVFGRAPRLSGVTNRYMF